MLNLVVAALRVFREWRLWTAGGLVVAWKERLSFIGGSDSGLGDSRRARSLCCVVAVFTRCTQLLALQVLGVVERVQMAGVWEQHQDEVQRVQDTAAKEQDREDYRDPELSGRQFAARERQKIDGQRRNQHRKNTQEKLVDRLGFVGILECSRDHDESWGL